jgi:septal ring factor EnvC (AmiA/AmiB activator)
MSETLTNILLGGGVLSFLWNIVSFFLYRKRTKAEIEKIESDQNLNVATENKTFTEIIRGMSENNKVLQERNQEIYQENVDLQKKVTDLDQLTKHLTDRLNERDTQLATVSNQLQNLQDSERQNEITNALRSQQQGLIELADAYKRIIDDRDMIIRNLKAKTGPLPPLTRD